MSEDQRREHKSSWRDEWMKSICGFPTPKTDCGVLPKGAQSVP